MAGGPAGVQPSVFFFGLLVILYFTSTPGLAFLSIDIDGQCYFLSENTVMYDEAEDECQQYLSMSLAQFTDDGQAKTVIESLDISSDQLDVWVYVDKTTISQGIEFSNMTISFFKWNDNEVASLWYLGSHQDHSQNCAFLYRAPNETGLITSPCSEQHRYVCESAQPCADVTFLKLPGTAYGSYYFRSLYPTHSQDIAARECNKISSTTEHDLALFETSTDFDYITSQLPGDQNRQYWIFSEIISNHLHWGSGPIVNSNYELQCGGSGTIICAYMGLSCANQELSTGESWGVVALTRCDLSEPIYFMCLGPDVESVPIVQPEAPTTTTTATTTTTTASATTTTSTTTTTTTTTTKRPTCTVPTAPLGMTVTLVENVTSGYNNTTVDTYIVWACADDPCLELGHWGTVTQYCMASGEWDGVPPMCIHMEEICTDPPFCDDGTMTCDLQNPLIGPELSCGAVYSQSCLSGFDGPPLSYLCLGGQWTPNDTSPLVCERHQCMWSSHDDLYILNAPSASITFDYETNLTLICQPGYKFPDSGSGVMFSYCDADGFWSPKIIPCEAFCPDLDHNTLKATISEVDFWWSVTITCYEGFSLGGGVMTSSHTCASGSWLPEVEGCRASCQSFPILPNANVTVQNEYSTIIDCKAGFQLNGSTSAIHKCRSGWWEPEVQDCTPVPCPSVNPAELNANVEWVSDSAILLTCLGDFLQVSPGVSAIAHRCDTGVWYPEIVACTVMCSTPQIPNAVVTLMNATSLDVSCHKGYTINNGSDVTFQMSYCVDGEWTPGVDRCYPATCPDIAESEASTVTFDLIDQEVVTAEMTCHDGFLFKDGSRSKTFVCDVSGDWSPEVEDCKAQCPDVNVTYATIKRFTSAGQAKADVTCATGYYYSADPSISSSVVSTTLACSDGVWSPELLQCHPEHCDALSVALSTTVDSGYYYGAAFVTLSCQLGASFQDGSGNKTFLCDHGSWLPSAEDCISSCDQSELTSLANTVVTVVSNVGGSLYEITCLEGFVMENALTSMMTSCTGSGVWEPSLAECNDVIHCSNISTLTNARPNTTTLEYPTAVTLTCSQGWGFPEDGTPGEQVVVNCGSNGEWNPYPPRCTRKNNKRRNEVLL